MSTASAAERPEGKGFAAWVAHREMMLAWFMVALGFFFVVEDLIQPLLPNWIGVCAALFSLLLFDFGFFAVWRAQQHIGHICTGCLEKMPLDGQERAARRERFLYAAHWMASKRAIRLSYGWFVVCIVSLFLFSPVVFDVLFFPSIAFILLLGAIHRPLVPFCKWCRGREGDGPREVVPTPTPVMIKTG